MRRNIALLVLVVALAACGGSDDGLQREVFGITAKVEQWRKLVEKYFKYQHVTWALNIIQCESGGDPNAYNSSSGASGLFQHLPQYWPSRAAAAGFPGASAFNAEANIAASAYLLYAAGGGPQHWSCKYSPFEDFNYQPQYYKDGVPVAPPQPCPTLPQSGGVIEEDGPCFELYGPAQYWRSVSGQGHNNALRWTNATQQSSPSNWARWQIKLAAAGKYTVKYYAVSSYAVFKLTRYTVRHAGQDSTLTVDQSAGGTGWRTLGTYNFAQGGGQHVSIYDNTSQPVAQDQHITADAIKLVPAVSPPSPPPAPDSGVTPPLAPDSGVAPAPAPDSGEPPPQPERQDGGLFEPSAAPDAGPGSPLPGPYGQSGAAPQGGAQLTGGCSVGGRGDRGAVLLPVLLVLGLWISARSRCGR